MKSQCEQCGQLFDDPYGSLYCPGCEDYRDMQDEEREDEPPCPWCGGEGIDEYDNCPEAWGEDTPAEINHLITCPQCKGSGLAKDCDVL